MPCQTFVTENGRRLAAYLYAYVPHVTGVLDTTDYKLTAHSVLVTPPAAGAQITDRSILLGRIEFLGGCGGTREEYSYHYRLFIDPVTYLQTPGSPRLFYTFYLMIILCDDSKTRSWVCLTRPEQDLNTTSAARAAAVVVVHFVQP
jgi:hypothetical protein